MSKELVALVFSDIHLNLWAKFNEDNRRTLNGFRVLHDLVKVSKGKVPILFCGDLFHKPDNIDSDLMEMALDQFKDIFTNSNFYMISGNHDIKHISRVNQPVFSWVKMVSSLYSKVTCLDYEYTSFLSSGIRVYGVPYIDHNIGISEYLRNLVLEDDYKNILLLHTDYPGAKDTDGREIDSVENLNLNVLNKFDLILCGHIHKPQRLSKKVYMIGAPNQHRRTDSNCELGYWKLYSDLSLTFIPLEGYPKFIDVENPEDIKEDGNYYTVLPKKSSVSLNTEHKITKQLSKKTLAKQYMKERGIKDKRKKNLLIDVLNKADIC